MEVHDDVIWGGVLVRCRRGHTVVHEQLQGKMAASVYFCLEVCCLSQVEGGG
jgi:hypothetical protein